MLSHEEQNFVKSQLVGSILIDKDGNELKVKSLNFHQEDVDIVFGRMSLVTIHQETALKLAETGESKNWKVKGFTPVEEILEGNEFEGLEDLENELEMEENFKDDYEVLVDLLDEMQIDNNVDYNDDNGSYIVSFAFDGSKEKFINYLNDKGVKSINHLGERDIEISQEEIQKLTSVYQEKEYTEEEIELFAELVDYFEKALKFNNEQTGSQVKVMLITRNYGIDLDQWIEIDLKDYSSIRALSIEKQKALLKELKYYVNPGVEYNPEDSICMDVPLFIRVLEWAREEAIDDLDLHKLTEKAINLMGHQGSLEMEDYNSLIPKEDE